MLDTHTRFVCIWQVKTDDGLLDTQLPYLDTYLPQGPTTEGDGILRRWSLQVTDHSLTPPGFTKVEARA